MYIVILPLLSGILVLYLGFFIFLKNKRSKLNLIFLFFSFATFIWFFGTFMMFLSKDSERALFWDKFVYIGVIFIPVLVYDFGMIFINQEPKKRKIIFYGYFFSTFFLILDLFSPFFINGTFKYEWGFHSRAQLFHHFFLFYFILYLFLLFYELYVAYKSSIGLIKEQLKYLFVALLFLTTGSIAFLPAYGMDVYPFAYISGVIFTVIMTYAIVRHQLMDIKLVMRRSSVYLFSLVSIILPAYGLEVALGILGFNNSILIDSSILIGSIALFPVMKDYYYRLANKYFFSSLYDTKKIISDLSNELRQTLFASKIYDFISSVLMNAFHVKALAILTYDKKSGNYNLKHAIGFDFGKEKFIVENKDIQEKYFSENKTIIVEELKMEAREEYKDFINKLLHLKIEVLTPLNLKNETVGVIVLGPKESGDMFNEEDFEVLRIVGAQAAMALENALLYEKTRRFNVKLRKEVEMATADLREANERLKKLDEAKSDFISIASHQLRTPLTAIKGYISMMLEGDFGPLTEKEKQVLELVFRSAERLINLVEDLLNLSRIESGRMQFVFSEIDLKNMVTAAVNRMKNATEAKGLELDFESPSDLPKVKMDEEKIKQIILNFIDNAIKHTDRGKISVGLKKNVDGIEFSVADTGAGIDRKALPDLFKRFTRRPGILVAEGMGLSLYLAKEILKAHRGRVWAESEGEGKGSVFHFLLPIDLESNKKSG